MTESGNLLSTFRPRRTYILEPDGKNYSLAVRPKWYFFLKVTLLLHTDWETSSLSVSHASHTICFVRDELYFLSDGTQTVRCTACDTEMLTACVCQSGQAVLPCVISHVTTGLMRTGMSTSWDSHIQHYCGFAWLRDHALVSVSRVTAWSQGGDLHTGVMGWGCTFCVTG